MTDVEALRKQFEARIAELLTEANDIEAELREPDSADWEERATEKESDEVMERLEQAAMEEVLAIRSALERIDAGTYGECTVCGEPIGEKRLEVVPYAAKCIHCASE